MFAAAKRALGMPFVPEVLQAYAATPEFLLAMWNAVAPALRNGEFLRCAERIRAQAYTEVFNYLGAIHNIGVPSPELADAIELFHCAAPRMLLLTITVQRALEAPVGRERETTAVAPPPCHDGVRLPAEHEIPPEARAVLEDFKARRRTPLAPHWLLAIARWPSFLREHWNAIKALDELPIYARLDLELRESAFNFADELPAMIDLTPERLAESDLSHEQIAEAARVTNLFARLYGCMVLDVEIAKIAITGGSARPSTALEESAGLPVEQHVA